MRKKLTHFLSAILACCMVSGCSGGGATTDPDDSSISSGIMDSADDDNYIAGLTAAKDFYGYINAADLMKMELNQTQNSVGTWESVYAEVGDQLDEIIKEIVTKDEKYAPGSNEQLIHDLYWQIYNTISAERKDPDGEDQEFIESCINKIEAVSDIDELLSVWHELAAEMALVPAYTAAVRYNINDYRERLLHFVLLTCADLDLIKNNNLQATLARDDFVSFLRLCGLSADEAKDRATAIIYMYYEIAGYTDPVALGISTQYYQKFHILTREECSAMLKNITYEQLVRSIGYDGELPDRIAVEDPGQLEGVDSLLVSEHLREWKDISLIALLQNYSNLLPSKYTTSGFDVLSPEKAALTYVKKFLSRQVGEIYVAKNYTAKKREIITKMCDDMVGEYYKLIGNADWLSDEGKAFLTEKLDNMQFFIGSDEPHEIDPADAELIGSTLLKTAYKYEKRTLKDRFDELTSGKPFNGFDQTTPITVNASYYPTFNAVVITAATLNKGLFDEDAEYASNLGAIGSLIGHEISHAFDSNGVNFDAHGNYCPDAMPKEDVKAFREIQNKAIKYYDSFKVLGSHVSGKNTLKENLADISGLQCVLSIAGTPENQKLAFESYARLWSTLQTDIRAKELISIDVHAPHSVRVNAVVALFDEFYEIYGVKEGDPMYIAPENRIRRW